MLCIAYYKNVLLPTTNIFNKLFFFIAILLTIISYTIWFLHFINSTHLWNTFEYNFCEMYNNMMLNC